MPKTRPKVLHVDPNSMDVLYRLVLHLLPMKCDFCILGANAETHVLLITEGDYQKFIADNQFWQSTILINATVRPWISDPISHVPFPHWVRRRKSFVDAPLQYFD